MYNLSENGGGCRLRGMRLRPQRAFKKTVVVGVGAERKLLDGRYPHGKFGHQGQHLSCAVGMGPKNGACEDVLILGQDCDRYARREDTRGQEVKNLGRDAGPVERCSKEDIGINDDAYHRAARRLRFLRAAAISASILRMVSFPAGVFAAPVRRFSRARPNSRRASSET